MPNRIAVITSWIALLLTTAFLLSAIGQNNLLSFQGRIERENWIDQAIVLAEGGQTDFSKRVVRGEVQSSRKDGEA